MVVQLSHSAAANKKHVYKQGTFLEQFTIELKQANLFSAFFGKYQDLLLAASAPNLGIFAVLV